MMWKTVAIVGLLCSLTACSDMPLDARPEGRGMSAITRGSAYGIAIGMDRDEVREALKAYPHFAKPVSFCMKNGPNKMGPYDLVTPLCPDAYELDTYNEFDVMYRGSLDLIYFRGHVIKIRHGGGPALE